MQPPQSSPHGRSSDVHNLIDIMISPIVDCFSPHQCDYQCLYQDEREFSPRTSRFKFSSVHRHIESFLNDLDESFSTISRADLFHEETGYQYPDYETVQRYRRAYDIGNNNHFVNESDTTVCIAKEMILARLFGHTRTFNTIGVTGKVGSGKSTFLDLLIETIMRDKANNQRVIYGLVKYENVKSFFLSKPTRDQWKVLFEGVLLDQIVFHGVRRMLHSERFQTDLKKWIDLTSRIAGYQKDIVDRIRDISEAMERPEFSDIWSLSFVETEMPYKTKIMLLNYLTLHYGAKLIFIFDGFDAFSLDKIIRTNNKEIVTYFAETLFKNGPILNLGLDKYCCIISLRDCTFTRLERILSPEDGVSIERWQICPPGVKKAIQRSIKKYAYGKNVVIIEENDLYARLNNIFFRIHDEIKKEFGTDDDDVVRLFNQNYRRMKKFFLIIIKHIVSALVFKMGQIQKEEFLSLLESYYIREILGRHGLTEIFVLGESKSFNNYFSDITMDSEDLKSEMNQFRGLVDNIFWYSLNGFGIESDIPPTLIKVRILQYLCQAKAHVGIKGIIDEMLELGYLINEDITTKILDIMDEAGFVKNRWSTHENIVVYKETDLGRYVIDNLLNNNRYIEHVVQKTAMPKEIVNHMRARCKYCNDDEDSFYGWVFWSSVNICIFYNYVLLLENNERYYYDSGRGSGKFEMKYAIGLKLGQAIKSLESVYSLITWKGGYSTQALMEVIKQKKTKLKASLLG